MKGSFQRFLCVGVINTMVGYGLMFCLYNLLGAGYWFSTFIANSTGAIISYTLNRSYTFRDKQPALVTAPKFFAVVMACYLFSYWLSNRISSLTSHYFSGISGENLMDNTAMVLGMVVYTLLNYLGQRFFAFEDNNERECHEKN